MKIIQSLCCCLIVVVGVACSKSTTPRERSKPVDAANPLTRLVGTWSVSTAIHQPDKPDIVSSAEDECQWLGTSTTLTCTYRADGGMWTGLSVRSWSPETGIISGYWMTSDNKNGPLLSTGHFDESTRTLDEVEVGLDPTGKLMKLRMVRTYSSNDDGIVNYLMVNKDGTEMPAFTSTLKRKSK